MAAAERPLVVLLEHHGADEPSDPQSARSLKQHERDEMSKPLRIAIVGLGKIAVDQHLPTIAAHDDLALVATVSQRTGLPGTPNFRSVEAAVAGCSDIDAFVLCTPPQGRYAIANAALLSGRHVFLEKPPAATLADVFALTELAKINGVSLFTSWHSRYAAAVSAARQWLVDKKVLNAEITWKEDVRRWHPGQDWIFAAGAWECSTRESTRCRLPLIFCRRPLP